MRHFILGFLAWGLVTGMLYLLGAFVAASWLPTAWGPFGRFAAVSLSVLLAVLIAVETSTASRAAKDRR
ncbi:hypothetical protein [Stenotrophomonas sp. GZD-301]|uniref:hypothetical protein n=1 Tax=Stenotrophomonas sp. GZD-301 TaxID=3404814 RepID=UPI003BB7497E